jgi:hypothetical protein
MDALLRYAGYFIMSGCLTVVVCSINERGNGGLAGLVAAFPIFFLLTGLIAYFTAGPATAFDYSRSMIISNVPWLAAVAVFAYAVQSNWNMGLASMTMLFTYTVIAYALKDMVM